MLTPQNSILRMSSMSQREMDPIWGGSVCLVLSVKSSIRHISQDVNGFIWGLKWIRTVLSIYKKSIDASRLFLVWMNVLLRQLLIAIIN